MGNILLKDANLYYSSLAYKETSFKSYIFKKISHSKTDPVHDIHALNNINLEINMGERVGLLGHNGAGKSTLLKAMAGVYPLSSGTRIVTGDIRAIFELSLGFEMEATGLENILYRGLLLGKTPSQMRQLQDEIVEFADLGEFINYPIKTYSAGMLVRLAFSISTSITGNILLIDESIGAGDRQFQEKAKSRIKKLIEKSELLVLASHSDATLKTLCNRGVLLNHGKIVFDGDITEAIEFYNDTKKYNLSTKMANELKQSQ